MIVSSNNKEWIVLLVYVFLFLNYILIRFITIFNNSLFNNLHLCKTRYSSPVYVWYCVHNFNRIIIEAVDSCIEVLELFTYLETLYDFIRSSKKHAAFYSNNHKKSYLNRPFCWFQRVKTIWWLSHSSVLQTVIDTND